MDNPNTRQVGGNHYKEGEDPDFQHWDLISRYSIGYLEGCATKYATRWRRKNGVEDLEKGLHYVEKLIQLATEEGLRPLGKAPAEVINRFARSKQLISSETLVLLLLCDKWTIESLEDARLAIKGMIIGASGEQG